MYFAATGTHTIRVQQREDGAIIDQIVISPDTFLTSPPGWRLDDVTILRRARGAAAAAEQPSADRVVDRPRIRCDLYGTGDHHA